MNRKKIFHFIDVILWVVFFIVVIQFIVKDLRVVRDGRPLFILRSIGLNYDSKMEMKIGKLPYDYVMFVKDNTPENSTILIPPQAYPWDKTSNISYLRYFLYPRKLVNGNEKDPKVDLKNIDYVLLDYGETAVSQYGYTNVWPKFDVNGEYIIYWNPLNGVVRKTENGRYVYDSGKKIEEWGIIKIKK